VSDTVTLVLTLGVCTANLELVMTVMATSSTNRKSIGLVRKLSKAQHDTAAPIMITNHLYGFVNFCFP